MNQQAISDRSAELIMRYYDNDYMPFLSSFADDALWYGPAEGQFIRGREAMIRAWLAEDHDLERSDARVRTLEGLERIKGFLSEPFETKILVDEFGIAMNVDIAEGQKTGYFLDQKYNHFAIRRLCEGRRVLDCCTHTGGFALNAALNAREVIGIDASDLAIAQAEENSRLNQFTNTRFEVADVFDYLIEAERNRERFDVIILDPPAFTKSRSSLKNASKGYKEINYRAMKLLNPGGFLITCSCSEYMQKELFMRIILSAANDSHRRLRLVESRAQAPDHPIILGNNVSEYLKCIIVQVNSR